MRRFAVGLTLVVALALAGCSAPVAGDGRPDPVFDQTGWENGYWFDDPVRVTATDGINQSEQTRVVARTMARVERIRGLEFKRGVSVEVISQTTYREEYGRNTDTDPWNEQRWEAPLLVGETETVSDVFGSTLDATVRGFYAPAEDEIVLVSDAASPTIDRQTLAHELVHALQDQHFDRYRNPQTQDERRAQTGVVEGDANYVMERYEQRCGTDWDCLPRPEQTDRVPPPTFNYGFFVTMFTPYAEGPSFVAAIRDREGWRGVNELYRDYPESTEQLIHPGGYPAETPQDVTVRDRSNESWERFGRESDTVGEAVIYAMFWANGQIDRDGRDRYDYDHRLSAGWAGDTLVPYRNDDRYGYVWETAWDTRDDASEFAVGYRAILANRSVHQPRENVYVLPESDPFGDAFRVTRRGSRVRIVNAPTSSELDGVHAR